MSSQPAPESVFTYGAPALKFGDGASDEIGYDLTQLGARRALVLTDAGVAATGLPARIAAQMAQFGVAADHLFENGDWLRISLMVSSDFRRS